MFLTGLKSGLSSGLSSGQSSTHLSCFGILVKQAFIHFTYNMYASIAATAGSKGGDDGQFIDMSSHPFIKIGHILTHVWHFLRLKLTCPINRMSSKTSLFSGSIGLTSCKKKKDNVPSSNYPYMTFYIVPL